MLIWRQSDRFESECCCVNNNSIQRNNQPRDWYVYIDNLWYYNVCIYNLLCAYRMVWVSGMRCYIVVFVIMLTYFVDNTQSAQRLFVDICNVAATSIYRIQANPINHFYIIPYWFNWSKNEGNPILVAKVMMCTTTAVISSIPKAPRRHWWNFDAFSPNLCTYYQLWLVIVAIHRKIGSKGPILNDIMRILYFAVSGQWYV
jgi:hypothetical protein